ncbi:MAG: sulfotransferase [Terrimicrobiaceae bacterium]
MKPERITEAIRSQLHWIQVAGAGASLSHFPDFLIVGPQRTGTTWLFHNLRTHPEIFMPPEKELYYFSTLRLPDHRHFRFECLEDYLGAMRDTPKSKLKKSYDSLRKSGRLYHPKVRGEATASYATLPSDVIREITLLNPEVKAILMVRDPIERAWSHARKDLTPDGRMPSEMDPEVLSRSLAEEKRRGLALYRTLAANWREHLQPGHLFVGGFDFIASTPQRLLSAIHDFLGVATGPRYFGRHLHSRINPAPSGEIPATVKGLFCELLEKESLDYRGLMDEIRASGDVSLRY